MIRLISHTVYKRIVKLFDKFRDPVPLYQVYNFCRGYDELKAKQVRHALKWLFDNGFLVWSREGEYHLIPRR